MEPWSILYSATIQPWIPRGWIVSIESITAGACAGVDLAGRQVVYQVTKALGRLFLPRPVWTGWVRCGVDR